MPVLILDPDMEAKYRHLWDDNDSNRHDECWEGVLVVPPLPNNEHQEVQTGLIPASFEIVVAGGLGRVYTGVNVTDRHLRWSDNYRGPDVVVYLTENPAVNHGTHWEGGPDFLVEIISPGEKPHAKFDFYAAVNTREVLIVNRDPWSLELHQLRAGRLVATSRSEVAGAAALASSVLPLTFKLVTGAERPKIEIVHPATRRTWEA